ncbi:MAG TPA: class I SAM-dependent methyltransferase [Vicinamibacterales bacterium]
MSSAVDKARYLLAGVAQNFRGAQCPSCGASRSDLIARKYVVTELRRCEGCGLMFRLPTFSAEASEDFYQTAYSQGFTTDMPDDRSLAELLNVGFKGTEKDYSVYLSVLEALGVRPGSRVFDFGCSWGYGSWQLQKHGYQVRAFEISRVRATYARAKLGLSVSTELPVGDHSVDVFFSAHVIEHVPSVNDAVRYGLSMLKPGGLFVAFTPNGSDAFRRLMPDNWMKAWGLVHPNYLDDVYYTHSWNTLRYLITSAPYPTELLRRWTIDGHVPTKGNLSGGELLFVAEAPRPEA